MVTGSVILWHGQTGRQIQSIAHPSKIGTFRLPCKTVVSSQLKRALRLKLFTIVSRSRPKQAERLSALQIRSADNCQLMTDN
jgi:hypothetical protein